MDGGQLKLGLVEKFTTRRELLPSTRRAKTRRDEGDGVWGPFHGRTSLPFPPSFLRFDPIIIPLFLATLIRFPCKWLADSTVPFINHANMKSWYQYHASTALYQPQLRKGGREGGCLGRRKLTPLRLSFITRNVFEVENTFELPGGWLIRNFNWCYSTILFFFFCSVIIKIRVFAYLARKWKWDDIGE